MTIAPAFGRDYKSAKEATEAFNAGKDFMLMSMEGSGYISKRDIPVGTVVSIRYKKLTQQTIVTVK